MNDEHNTVANERRVGYSWGPCAWIVISEIWPISNRPFGIALGASSNWMNNFIVGQVTPDMLTGMRYGTYIFFGLLTAGGALFVYLVVPETKALSLEEMDILFGSIGHAARDQEIMNEINREVGLVELVEEGRRKSSVVAAPDEKRTSETAHENGSEGSHEISEKV
jgi:hypothetical protein